MGSRRRRFLGLHFVLPVLDDRHRLADQSFLVVQQGRLVQLLRVLQLFLGRLADQHFLVVLGLLLVLELALIAVLAVLEIRVVLESLVGLGRRVVLRVLEVRVVLVRRLGLGFLVDRCRQVVLQVLVLLADQLVQQGIVGMVRQLVGMELPVGLGLLAVLRFLAVRFRRAVQLVLVVLVALVGS